VVAALVDKAHPLRVDVRLARRVVALVHGHRAGGDDDQAVAGMRVPAGGAAGLPDIALDVQVGQPMCLPRGTR
jgi:hypothetical protein